MTTPEDVTAPRVGAVTAGPADAKGKGAAGPGRDWFYIAGYAFATGAFLLAVSWWLRRRPCVGCGEDAALLPDDEHLVGSAVDPQRLVIAEPAESRAD